MKLSSQIASIAPSPTLSISAKAKALVRDGIDVVSFSAGEPDFQTPEPIRDAAKAAIDAGQTTYTAVGGTPDLKAAIAAYYDKKIGVTYGSNEIAASCGAKHTLYNLFLALLEPGDEVIIPAPYWVSYPAQVKIAGGVPVAVSGRASDGFLPTVEALEAAVTSKTRAIVINNPTNPTGAFWEQDALTKVANWLDAHPDIAVISDAIYDELVYDDLKYVEILELAPSLAGRYFIVNGISKAFAMTGWRLGYVLGPSQIIKGIETLQSQSTSNPCSVTQAAAISALEQGEDVIAPMRAAFQGRRDLIFDLLTDVPGVDIAKPRGAFYAFPNVASFIGKAYNGDTLADDFAIANYLLDVARVAVVPGSAFGAPGFVRMSYASSEDTIREGVRRMASALAKLA